jgi:membrane-associated protease RseP (regulator of RpoE activity)
LDLGLAQKYGFAVGDRILKINSREITSSSEFQKKIKSVANPTFQIEYKPKFGPQRTRSITLPSPDTYFGASTEPQNIALVKPGSSIASISRGPNTVFCSASINKEGSTLFVNFILDSQMPSRKTPVGIKIIDKTSNKVLGDAVEEVPLSGGNPSLISRSFGVSSNPSRVQVIVGFEKQQFGFEFQN